MFVYVDEVYCQTWQVLTLKNCFESSHCHMPLRPMLLHRMAHVSFRLFWKYLGYLQEFFGKWFTAPPPLPPANNFPCAYGRRRSRKKWKRSDSSDSDSVALTTPIFYFYYVISALTASLTTPTPSLVTFPLVVPRATVGNYVCVCGQVKVIPSTRFKWNLFRRNSAS